MKVTFQPPEPRLHFRGPAFASTGDVWLEIGDVAFPAQGWNDFIVPILTAFCEALARLLSRSSQRELVLFMDGPYGVQINVTPAGWRIEASSGLSACPVEVDALIESALARAKAVLSHGDALLATRDGGALETAYRRLDAQWRPSAPVSSKRPTTRRSRARRHVGTVHLHAPAFRK